nr:hypothetical protein Iba_chr10bCG9250 [Ipomoea batatas]
MEAIIQRKAGSSVQGWPPVTTPFLSGGELGGPVGGVRTSGQQLPSPVDGSLTEQGAATTSSRLPGGVTRQPRRSLDVARLRSSGEDGRQPRRRSLLLDVLHAAMVNLIWSLSPLLRFEEADRAELADEAGSSVQGWPPVTTPFLSGGELGGPAGGVRTSGQQLPSPVDGSLTEQGTATTSSRLPGGVTRQPRRSLDVARQRSSSEDGRQPRRRSLLLDVLHAATVNLICSLSPLLRFEEADRADLADGPFSSASLHR